MSPSIASRRSEEFFFQSLFFPSIHLLQKLVLVAAPNSYTICFVVDDLSSVFLSARVRSCSNECLSSTVALESVACTQFTEQYYYWVVHRVLSIPAWLLAEVHD